MIIHKENNNIMNYKSKFWSTLIFIITIGSVSSLYGQTRYFDERYIYTQAQLMPQLINPGAFGYAMEHQVLLNYRNKWAGIDGAPRTVTLSYNGPVGNRLGLGVLFLSDRFGEFETVKGAFGVSYTISSESNQIGFGLTGEYIRHSLAGFGNSNPSDPVIGAALNGVEYFDASFGIYGIYLKKLSYGIALPSMVSARISEVDEVSPERDLGFIFQVGYRLESQKGDMSITPGIIAKRLANVPTHLDLNVVFGFLGDKLTGGINYTLGADKRLGFLIGAKVEKINILYSYNTSSNLIQDYNNGSHELTLGVNFGKLKPM